MVRYLQTHDEFPAPIAGPFGDHRAGAPRRSLGLFIGARERGLASSLIGRAVSAVRAVPRGLPGVVARVLDRLTRRRRHRRIATPEVR